ncbi:MAG: phospholipase D family protein [Betaproteobacteria bacterium]|nr:MAG: phospholipase D family protein [Betaproteobacteria bacterium]
MKSFRGLATAALLLIGGCAGLPANIERTESRAFSDTAATRLGQASQAMLKARPGDSGFRPLRSGVDALLARIVLAEAAERSLDVQYYIWHDDLTGRHFANALLRAADRGVRVRVLLDDLGVKANDENLLALDSHANIEIRLFNPVASRTFRGLSMLTDFSRVNRRMHNKAFIADNQAAILGGRNIGDEYFEADSEVAFGDLDVLMTGPGVNDASTAFDRFWNAPMSIPVPALLGRSHDMPALDALRAELAAFITAQRDSPYVKNAGFELAEKLTGVAAGIFWGKAHLLYDDPAKIDRAPDDPSGHLLPQFANIGSKVQKELLIVSPYFIPGEAGVTWLANLVKRGVRVTVLTNSLAATDVGAVHAGYSRYRMALLEGGVKLHELKPDAIEQARASNEKRRISGSRASLHAKTFVFDRQAVFIGSLNLDPRSVQLNTEIGVVCESPPLARELADSVEQNLGKIAWRLERVVDTSGNARIAWNETGAGGMRQQLQEPEVSGWRKFSVWFLSLLPIESQL